MNNLPTEPILINSITPEEALAKGANPELIEDILILIDKLKIELTNSRPLSEIALKKLAEYKKIDHIYNSNAIEGNTLTRSETAIAIEGFTVNQKPIKDYLETDSLHKAYDYIKSLTKRNSIITEDEIKKIHSLVLNYDEINRGKYRTEDVMITNTTYSPPISEQIPSLMKNLLFEYDKFKLHPIEKIARFHAEFESIHPFIDGNGRTSRLLINLQLLQNEYPQINIKYSDRAKYYSSLQAYNLNNNPQPIIQLTATYILQELQTYLTLIHNRDQTELQNNETSTNKFYEEKLNNLLNHNDS
jgi:Fic family protein